MKSLNKLFVPLSIFKIIILLIGITTLLSNDSRSSEIHIMIKNFCLDEYKRELNEAELKLDENIAELTCHCFVNKIKAGESLNSAHETCKEKVVKKFNL